MSSSPKTLNDTEQHQLLEALLENKTQYKSKRKGIRNYLIGCLMLEAGLRVGEVVQLKMSHLYFNGKPVQTLVLTENITKNHKERTVPISARLKEALEEYYDHYPPPDVMLYDARCFRAGCPHLHITTRTVERFIRKAAMKAFGRPVHPHMLRHTFATKLMRVTDMNTVSELLGHSDITSTQIYCHPNEDDKKKAIEEIDGYMSLTKEQKNKTLGPHPLSDHLNDS